MQSQSYMHYRNTDIAKTKGLIFLNTLFMHSQSWKILSCQVNFGRSVPIWVIGAKLSSILKGEQKNQKSFLNFFADIFNLGPKMGPIVKFIFLHFLFMVQGRKTNGKYRKRRLKKRTHFWFLWIVSHLVCLISLAANVLEG